MSTRRVLLVEDEDDIREIAALSLEMGGWSVTAVADGPSAVRAALQDPPDAVLLDVMMPGQDGPTALAAMRGEGVTAPVVFLTAKAQAREREHLLSLGAVAVLAKPFDPLTLADDVCAALGWEA